MRVKGLAILSLTFLISCQSHQTHAVDLKAKPTNNDGLKKWSEIYYQRYGVDDLFDKITDNHGDGYEDLYGTRNMRMVLKGVVYRGGANNAFHKDNKRPNRNPMPGDGLSNLCQEGFGRTVYLYKRNFEQSKKSWSCQSFRQKDLTLKYEHYNPIDLSGAKEVLRMIHQNIQDFKYGPIYLHCWNGWHASGLISAYTLRQFCGWSAEEAVAYWDKNTDGNNTLPGYEKIRQRIRDFTPYKEFKVGESDQKLICPKMN